MSLNLPEHASFEYLKKLAKERLALLRARNPATKPAAAQLAIAREYGFSSWRALKAEMDLLAAGMACAEPRVDYSIVTGRYDGGVFRESFTAMWADLRSERPPSHLWFARWYLSCPQGWCGPEWYSVWRPR
jgi:hypothetical protein